VTTLAVATAATHGDPSAPRRIVREQDPSKKLGNRARARWFAPALGVPLTELSAPVPIVRSAIESQTVPPLGLSAFHAAPIKRTNVNVRSPWSGWPIYAPFPLNDCKECQHRADEAKILAMRTHDLWERETLLRIATQWQLLASHKTSKGARQTH
jgi:hypothetical protein